MVLVPNVIVEESNGFPGHKRSLHHVALQAPVREGDAAAYKGAESRTPQQNSHQVVMRQLVKPNEHTVFLSVTLFKHNSPSLPPTDFGDCYKRRANHLS